MALRIVGGSYRGRRLIAPPGRVTRPTSERVREAIFNLATVTEGVTVLDLFAGSGALGLEAMSRGAGHVTFVDADRASQRAIEMNARAVLGSAVREQFQVIRSDAIAAVDRIARRADRFGLVFIDPPYSHGPFVARRLASRLGTLCDQGAIIVFETSVHEAGSVTDVIRTEWQVVPIHVRRYGDTVVIISGAPQLNPKQDVNEP